MQQLEFRKELVYKAKNHPEIIEVPEMLFVSVEGSGTPENSQAFQEAMQVLFGIVYTIKFWDKKHEAPSGYAKFQLTPLEALWWSGSGTTFKPKDASDWRWQVMIRVPEFVTSAFFQKVVNELIAQKQDLIYGKAKLISLKEGTCVQIMHIGPYDQEAEDIEDMHAFAREQGYVLTGKHHELYFSDPRRTAPEKLKTLIRQPVAKRK